MAKKPDTSEYSSTKAPETREHAEERVSTRDFRLTPGGEHGTPSAQGMAGLNREDVPSMATDAPKPRDPNTGRPESA